jgi:ubiquitin C-terminal hydrolase
LRRKIGRRKTAKSQPLLLYTKPPLIGLNRSGQPFFFNPVLQCLSNIPELTNFFLFNYNFFKDENMKAFYPFSHQYSNLISKLWRKPSEEDSEINNYPYYEKSFQPFEIKQYLTNIDNSVLIQQKNMFRELFLSIIKILDSELNNFKSSFKNINNYNNNNDN